MSDNRLDTPTIVNAAPPCHGCGLRHGLEMSCTAAIRRAAERSHLRRFPASPPFEPLLEVAEPCDICGGNGTFAGVRCYPCNGTGHAPHAVTEDDGDIGNPIPVGGRPPLVYRPLADALADAVRNLLAPDGGEVKDDWDALHEALRRYEEAS